MGYLSPLTITIDAILTKKGRELLARGDGSFQITQFALSDDEVDYTTYNFLHPSGSAYFGEAIENLPLLEAFPDETQIMKYKLVTLPRGTSKLPVLNIGYTSIVLRQASSLTITPSTLNYLGATNVVEPSGYVAIVGDVRLLGTFAGIGIDTSNLNISDVGSSTGTKVTKTVIGSAFSLIATSIDTLFGTNNSLQTTITFIGRDSGARITIPLTIKKTN